MSILDDLPDTASVTVPVGWLRSALQGADHRTPDDADAAVPLTVADVAERTGRSPSTVRSWLGSGELEGFQRGRTWYVWPDALRAFFEAAESRHHDPDDTDPDPPADLGAWRDAS